MPPPLPRFVLMHPSALPGRYGLGEIGPEAWQWLEVLGEAGVSGWVLPQPLADPMLLSLDLLRQDGMLIAKDLAMLPQFDLWEVDAPAVLEVRRAFMELAARRFIEQCDASPLMRGALDAFADLECAWLDDAALFFALQREHGQEVASWPEAIAKRKPEAMDHAMVSLAHYMDEFKASFYLLGRQWRRLQTRASQQGVKLYTLASSPAVVSALDQWVGRDINAEATAGLFTAEAELDAEALDDGCLEARQLFGAAEEGEWRFQWSDVTTEVLAQLVRTL